jgi:hypothetical protein
MAFLNLVNHKKTRALSLQLKGPGANIGRPLKKNKTLQKKP